MAELDNSEQVRHDLDGFVVLENLEVSLSQQELESLVFGSYQCVNAFVELAGGVEIVVVDSLESFVMGLLFENARGEVGIGVGLNCCNCEALLILQVLWVLFHEG